ncbi:FeoB-associated Cys-rich membrane protein [Caminicella sporogenes]|uniref:FeoB-associated Cys-rich membrane protein n=1 Tax=Caminicella sporogenes TaxID=166485 RepID=UPI00253FB462|nr:FeoB-associated Cys-rich membrane protein [Caminicella sporogenes]WIF95434.1 FeoB-associated Cys-rich membrane protein [Caminicella sporogenes]
MDNVVTWVIALPIISFGAYSLIKSVKKGSQSCGLGGCSSCSYAKNCASKHLND